jgi:hypothetical protein
MDTKLQWPAAWQEIQRNIAKQPRCPQHPEYPTVSTLAQKSPNDIISITDKGILVRSHKTMREDFIEVRRFEIWWDYLTQNGSASLKPGGTDNPHPWRSKIVGAILAAGLPKVIKAADANTLKSIG